MPQRANTNVRGSQPNGQSLQCATIAQSQRILNDNQRPSLIGCFKPIDAALSANSQAMCLATPWAHKKRFPGRRDQLVGLACKLSALCFHGRIKSDSLEDTLKHSTQTANLCAPGSIKLVCFQGSINAKKGFSVESSASLTSHDVHCSRWLLLLLFVALVGLVSV